MEVAHCQSTLQGSLMQTKGEGPSAGNLKRHINVCTHSFQTNLIAARVVNLEMLSHITRGAESLFWMVVKNKKMQSKINV